MNFLFNLQDKSQLILPFNLMAHQKFYLHSLDVSYLQQKKQHLFMPQSNRYTIITLMYLLTRIQSRTDTAQFLFLVQTQKRKRFVYELGKYLLNKNFKSSILWQSNLYQQNNDLHIATDMSQLYKNKKILFICTVQQFAAQQFFKDNTGTSSFLFCQTTHIVNTLNSLIEDYITDSYIRRAYIQACKLQNSYKSTQKTLKSQKSSEQLSSKKSEIMPLINLVSKQSQSLEDNAGLLNENKGIFRTYQEKKQQIKSKSNGNLNQGPKYQKNQLILISLMIYLLGFLQNIISPKKAKSIKQFIEQFQNKTLLSGQLLQQMPKYLKRIMKNCPNQKLYTLENMYLYHIWEFLRKIQLLRNLYPSLQDKAIVVRYQKFGTQRNEQVHQQSYYAMRLCLLEPKKVLSILENKTRNFVFVQCLKVPEGYLFSNFGNKLSLQRPAYNFSNLYGIHMSKTPSNQDIQFTKTTKNMNNNIKMKACGVMLYQIAQFVPDGIVVYFNSSEALNIFLSLLKKEDEKILKKINNTKKIFIETQFENQNVKNYAEFEKCCNIGKGAIFLLSATSNLAITQQFFHHYSNCIIFIGLPKQLKQRDEQDLDKQQSQFALMLRCLNNCINQISEAKGLIFVGRQINNGLDKWVPSVHIWDQTTRVPLPALRNHYKNMQKIKKQKKLH